MLQLDTAFVRSQFPAFSEPALKDWGFFENAGGSYTCRQVIDRLTAYYTQTKVQPYYPYPASQAAGTAMDEAYLRMAEYLNVGRDDVHFGPSTSQNGYVLAQAFRERWSPGDEIVVTNQDHEANSGFWRRLENSGIVIKEWCIDPLTGLLDPQDLGVLLSDRTRMLAFPHCSNVIGYVNPVAEIAVKAKAAGARVVVDGVAYAPHGLPDVGVLGVDVYLFSLYKTWGPHLGVMTIKRDLLDELPNQGHFFNADVGWKKLVPAGPDHAQVAAAAGVADYLDAVYQHHFTEAAAPAEKNRRLKNLFLRHETELLAPLMEWLQNRDDLDIVGPSELQYRAPTVCIVPKQKPITKIYQALTADKIMAGCGHYYAARPLQAMGISLDTGVIRLSFLHYTIREEIDQLISALDRALN